MSEDELKPLIDKLIMISERASLGTGIVAELAGVTQPAVSGWRSRKKSPNIENVQIIANNLGLNLSQLLVIGFDDLNSLVEKYKQHRKNNNVYEVSEPKVVYGNKNSDVPLVSDVQAGKIEEAFMDVYDYKMYSTKKNHSIMAYALKVSGTSMTADSIPTFPEGTIIFADPHMIDNINNKDFVIAKIDHEDAVTFKQFRVEAGKPYLYPLNREFPKIWQGFRVIAKVFDVYTDDWI